MGGRNSHPRTDEGPSGADTLRSSYRLTTGAHVKCSVCENSCTLAGAPVLCTRCDRRCCARCVVKVRYGSSTDLGPSASRTLLCTLCDAQPNIVTVLPRDTWMKIQEYCNESTRQQLLQLCHATQLGVLLPYTYGRFGWSSFFAEKTFLSKGANGAVFKTHLRDDLPEGIFDAHRTPHNSDSAVATTGRYGKPVAIKTIQKANVYSVRKWSHIHREVEALRRCQHRHVVQLLFVAQGPSEVYLALQYVEGGDLFDWLVRQQVPSEEDVGIIARQLLVTLHYLHETCGVVHRDVKPENILLDTGVAMNAENRSDGDGGGDNTEGHLYIRLADFGYAKILPGAEVEQGSGAEGNPTPGENRTPPTSGPAVLPPLSLPPRPFQGGVGGSGGGSGRQGAAAAREAMWDRAGTHSASSRGGKRGRGAMVSSTPCGTLGFAAPEILNAYNAQKEAQGSLSPSPSRRTQRGRDDDAEGTGAVTGAGPQTHVDLIKRMDIFAAGVTIAILLTGCEPFPCFSSKEHLDAVQSGVDFSGPQWRYVSREAKRLLRGMLSPRAADRPSAFECLHSRWLEQYHSPQHPEDDTKDRNAEDANDFNNDVGGAARREQMTRSFRNSVRSLRKNDGWLFVQNAAGVVATAPRALVEEGEGSSRAFPAAISEVPPSTQERGQNSPNLLPVHSME